MLHMADHISEIGAAFHRLLSVRTVSGGGRGQTLGYFSPCGKEERKISDISRRTLVIGANLRQTARGRNTGPVRMTV